MITQITRTSPTHHSVTTAGTHVFVVDHFCAELVVTISHKDARVWIFGLYELRDNQQCTVNITQHHTVAGAQSFTLIKSILHNRSHLNLSGTIRIDADAPQTTASLSHHTLLVSGDAYVTTQPILEVVPANVSCHHSATISSVSELHTNYLAMRGLSHEQSQELLIAGFINDLRMQQERIILQQSETTR